MTFAMAVRKYFGKLEDQSFSDFAAEIKALTDKDRADLAPLLSAELGVEVTL